MLSNYPKADVTVRTTEADLDKAKRQREAMVLTGYRVAEIAMQEAVVKSSAEETKLKTLEVLALGQAARHEAARAQHLPAGPRARAGQAASS